MAYIKGTGGVEAKLPLILNATLVAASVSCSDRFISGTKCHCPHIIIGWMGHRTTVKIWRTIKPLSP